MDCLDCVLVGQGLAGTTLAWQLRLRGKRVLVIDREPAVTSSRISAGLITPITGQRLVKTWRLEEFHRAAVGFYRRIEGLSGASFLHRRPTVRLFVNEEERALFETRRNRGEYGGLVSRRAGVVSATSFVDSLGGFEMVDAGRLDVPAYLQASREVFSSDDDYLTAEIDVERDLQLETQGVVLPRLGIRAERLIFCQGFEASGNRWFREVRFDATKGEILMLRIPGLGEERIVHHGVWIAPAGGDLYRAGATYEREALDCTPTTAGRDEMCERLAKLLRVPFEVVGHSAAVRPIVMGRHPVIGLHPEYEQLGMFNGLGSKGSLQAPLMAERFAGFLAGTGTLEPEVDLNRRFDLRGCVPPGSGEPVTRGASGGARTSRSLRLTQQAHEAVCEVLKVGEAAVDATAGNGHDTQFLAVRVGAEGTVFAFDVQQQALDQTAQRLDDQGLENVRLLQRSHAELARAIPRTLHGRIGAAMFNLGYLPGGTKSLTTQTETTQAAVRQALELLRPGGVVTIVAYTGHPGGADEATAVAGLLDSLPSDAFAIEQEGSSSGGGFAPRLFVVRKR